MGLGTLTLAGMLLVPGQGANDLSPINQRNIQIPIRFDPKRRADIKELLLFVSKNQGERWEQSAIATPDKDHFTFTAPADGVYWFNMMVIDRNGGRDPANLNAVPPESILKVLIDTQPPLVNIKSLERFGEEVMVSWEIQEPYPELRKLDVAYKAADGSWVPVETSTPQLSATARFRPNHAGPLSVRVRIQDMAGNQGELTREVGATNVASNPMSSNISPASNRVTLPAEKQPDPVPSQWQPPTLDPRPAVDPVATRQEPTGTPLAVSNPVSPPINSPLPAAQVINVAKFDLAFDVEQRGPSGVSKAEVWVTR